jgi:TolB-like protein/Tfp pilus assembly protein PilF
LAARAYALTQRVGFTREDLAAAADLARQASELDPAAGRARAVLAWVQACHLMRNWDLSDARRAEVQSLAQRALALAPDDGDALNALFQVLEKQRAFEEAERVARRAVQVAPDNVRSHLSLGRALDWLGREEDGLEVLRAAVKRFPRDPICRYELASGYIGFGYRMRPLEEQALREGLGHIDAALAVTPFASALLLKAVNVAAFRGDLTTLRAELDRLGTLSVSDRTEDRAVYVAMWAGLLERRPERTLAAANLTARTYFEDSIVAGPKAWLTALARRMEGKEVLARQEWQAAEAELRARLAAQPGSQPYTVQLATTLAWLDRKEEAELLVAPIERAWSEQPTPSRHGLLARYHAAAGNAPAAAKYLRQVLNRHSFMTDRLLRLDPWWERVSGHPAVQALAVEAGAERASGGNGAAAEKVAAATKSVAVLAFENRSDDRANDYFSDGISEELAVVLGKVSGLRVAGWTSMLALKGSQASEMEAARRLGVSHIVAGSVQRSGNRVRISARLVAAADGFQLWADRFDREAKDIFAVQEEIAGVIARHLQLQLGVGGRAERAVDPEAHRLVLEGRHFRRLSNDEGFARAEASFQAALGRDPSFAEAHAGLAAVYVVRATYRQRTADAPEVIDDLRRARDAAERAVALDAGSAEAQGVLAYTRFMQGDTAAARSGFERALAVNPNAAGVVLWSAAMHQAEGRLDLALRGWARVDELDPLWFVNLHLYAESLFFAGRYPEALRMAERAAQLRTDVFVPNLGLRAQILAALGRQAEATQLAREIRRSLPADTRWAADAAGIHVLRQGGAAAEADAYAAAVLAGVDLRSQTWAQIHMANGRAEVALTRIGPMKPTENRFFFWDPIWDPMRADARFLAKLEEMGLGGRYRVAREAYERLRREAAERR